MASWIWKASSVDWLDHCFLPANDTMESVFGRRTFPRREWGSNLGPLAPEASALTTELPRLMLIIDFKTLFLNLFFERLELINNLIEAGLNGLPIFTNKSSDKMSKTYLGYVVKRMSLNVFTDTFNVHYHIGLVHIFSTCFPPYSITSTKDADAAKYIYDVVINSNTPRI